jgi:hypothetical protein
MAHCQIDAAHDIGLCVQFFWTQVVIDSCSNHLGRDFNRLGLAAVLAAHGGSFLTGGP